MSINLFTQSTNLSAIEYLFGEGRTKIWVLGTQTSTNCKHLRDGGVLNPKRKIITVVERKSLSEEL